MDRWIDILTKYLPGPIIIALITIVMAFFAVFYFRRYRIYADVFQDRWFLNVSVLIIAAAVFYMINSEPNRRSKTKALLIVPLFKNDDASLYRTALISQLETEFAVGDERAIEVHEQFIPDVDTAKRIASSSGAAAVLYKASVIDKDNSTVACFSILVPKTGLIKSCPMVPLRIPKDNLSDIANVIRGGDADSGAGNGAVNQEISNELTLKINALEKELADMRLKSEANTAHSSAGGRKKIVRDTSLHSDPGERAKSSYQTKHALVIGINNYASTDFRLASAASDAQDVSRAFKILDFKVTVLLNDSATKENILTKLRLLSTNSHDLVMVYFAGMTAVFGDAPAEKQLHLLPYDFESREPSSGLPILDLTRAVQTLQAEHQLIIIDGCYGTTGLTESSDASPLVRKDRHPTLLVLAGTQDGQYALDSSRFGGGAFTQSFLRVLKSGPPDVTIQGLLLDTDRTLKTQGILQQPKLIRLSGSDDIILKS